MGALDRCKWPGLDQLLRDIFSPAVFPLLQQWQTSATLRLHRPPKPRPTAGTAPPRLFRPSMKNAGASASSASNATAISATAPFQPTDPMFYIDTGGAGSSSAQTGSQGNSMSKKQKAIKGKKGASKPGKVLQIERNELQHVRRMHLQARNNNATLTRPGAISKRLGLLYGMMGGDIDQPIVIDDDDDEEEDVLVLPAAGVVARADGRVPLGVLRNMETVDLTGDDDEIDMVGGGVEAATGAGTTSEAEMNARLDALASQALGASDDLNCTDADGLA